jgi:hypothetical protein
MWGNSKCNDMALFGRVYLTQAFLPCLSMQRIIICNPAALQGSYLPPFGMNMGVAWKRCMLLRSSSPFHLLQDVSGGRPVAVQGTDLPLYGMEIDVAAAAAEIRAIGRESDGSKQVDDFLTGLGLGVVADQLKDLRLSEYLNSLLCLLHLEYARSPCKERHYHLQGHVQYQT